MSLRFGRNLYIAEKTIWGSVFADDPGGADQWQHWHRAGVHRSSQGLQAHPDYACFHVIGAPHPAQGLRGRARSDGPRQGDEGRGPESRGDPEEDRQLVHAAAV